MFIYDFQKGYIDLKQVNANTNINNFGSWEKKVQATISVKLI